MRQVRRASERGHLQHGWLDTFHTFSFADYYDPRFLGFRSLRVLNEDRIAPTMGFGMHPHRDMEIITYVLSGSLEHRDSMGHGAVLRPGEVQHMSAGTGIRHSEFNPDPQQPVHLYQIWLVPNRPGLQPSYAQKAFPHEEKLGQLRVIASPEGRDGSLKLHQDASLYLVELRPGQFVQQEFALGRHLWLQVLRGQVSAGEQVLQSGDGLAVSEESTVTLRAHEDSEVMVFDLA